MTSYIRGKRVKTKHSINVDHSRYKRQHRSKTEIMKKCSWLTLAKHVREFDSKLTQGIAIFASLMK
jgi:hypothetical protein